MLGHKGLIMTEDQHRIQDIINALTSQRDTALNTLAQMTAQNAALVREIERLRQATADDALLK